MPNINDVAAAVTSLAGLTGAQYTAAALAGSTAAPGDLTGAVVVAMSNSGANPGTYTTRTAAQMIADAGLQVGQVYLVILANAQATGTLTLAGGTGVTISGTATVAPNTARIYTVTVTTGGTLTIQNVCSIVAP